MDLCQMQMLSTAGCNELQGYLFFRAMPERAIADVLQAQQRVGSDDESEAVYGNRESLSSATGRPG